MPVLFVLTSFLTDPSGVYVGSPGRLIIERIDGRLVTVHYWYSRTRNYVGVLEPKTPMRFIETWCESNGTGTAKSELAFDPLTRTLQYGGCTYKLKEKR